VLVVAYTAGAPNFGQPFIDYAFASAAIFLFVARFGGGEWFAVLIAAVMFSLCHVFFSHAQHLAGAASLSLQAGMLGRGGLMVLGWKAIWANSTESRRLYRIWLVPVGILLFVFLSMIALSLNVLVHLRALDLYLYAFDGSLGFQPSLVVRGLVSRYGVSEVLIREVYSSLPLAVGFLCAGFLVRQRSPWRLLAILGSAGVLAYLTYFVFPATGPLYFLGSSFTGSAQPLATLRQMLPHAVVPFSAPRNAMPSLHMAWALLLWFNCRPFSKIARGVLLLYLGLTLAATLGTGEHYLIDLEVALPFAVAVQALWADTRETTRYAVGAAGSAMTLAWLLALRYGTGVFLLSPVIPWACVLASTVISLRLERRLQVVD
jgi:hypothetical protein